jgi:hypothetical protein
MTMVKNVRGWAAAVGAAAGCLAATGAMAQSSPYYLTNGDGRHVVVAQNGVETNRWEVGIYCYPIAVSGGQVRICDGNGFGAPGEAYDLDGNFVEALQQRAEGSFILDSTTDGTFNYYSNDATLYRTNLDWSDATPLFSVTGGLFSITYDSRNESIWVTGGALVTEYSLATGQQMAQFNSGEDNNCGLAYEPSSNTLWMFRQGSNQFRQYDRDGTLLDTVAWDNPFGDNVIGGEFEISRGGNCYPDFTEDGELDLFDFLEYVNAFNAGDAAADCDENEILDLFDFLCFVNAFNEGC